MESVRAGTGSFILEEARTCYEFSRWADVTLISSSDCVAIKVHSLVLGAACPMLQSAMAEMGQIDQDEMAVIVPDTNKEDLLMFGNYLYNNHNLNQPSYSSLLDLINFGANGVSNSTLLLGRGPFLPYGLFGKMDSPNHVGILLPHLLLTNNHSSAYLNSSELENIYFW